MKVCAETVKTEKKILHDELHMKKVYVTLFPKIWLLTKIFLERLDEKLEFMKNIITWDEIWIFQYDVET